jgi:ribosomal protein S18 acetylase RimI-like enzyme
MDGECEKMNLTVRKAEEKDIPALDILLSEVLEIHAELRPDIFISGTKKYTNEELTSILHDEKKPVFVCVDENDDVKGYAFCIIKKQPFTTNMHAFNSLFIDDLCVDRSCRGMHAGETLFQHVRDYAEENNCYEVTLDVWEGNDSARGFYDHIGFKPKETIMEYKLK